VVGIAFVGLVGIDLPGTGGIFVGACGVGIDFGAACAVGIDLGAACAVGIDFGAACAVGIDLVVGTVWEEGTDPGGLSIGWSAPLVTD